MKKECEQFASKINELVTGEKIEYSSSDNKALPGTEFIAGTLKGTIDTFKGVFSTPAVEERVAQACPSCTASMSGVKGSVVKCPYCNTEITL